MLSQAGYPPTLALAGRKAGVSHLHKAGWSLPSGSCDREAPWPHCPEGERPGAGAQPCRGPPSARGAGETASTLSSLTRTSAGAPVPARCPPGTWSEEGSRTPGECQPCSGEQLCSGGHPPIWPVPCHPGWANSLSPLTDRKHVPRVRSWPQCRVSYQRLRGGSAHQRGKANPPPRLHAKVRPHCRQGHWKDIGLQTCGSTFHLCHHPSHPPSRARLPVLGAGPEGRRPRGGMFRSEQGRKGPGPRLKSTCCPWVQALQPLSSAETVCWLVFSQHVLQWRGDLRHPRGGAFRASVLPRALLPRRNG